MQDILRIFEKYYADLYTSGQPHQMTIDSFFANHSLFKALSETHKQAMNAKISREEILHAIGKLKKQQSSGARRISGGILQNIQGQLDTDAGKNVQHCPPSWGYPFFLVGSHSGTDTET